MAIRVEEPRRGLLLHVLWPRRASVRRDVVHGLGWPEVTRRARAPRPVAETARVQREATAREGYRTAQSSHPALVRGKTSEVRTPSIALGNDPRATGGPRGPARLTPWAPVPRRVRHRPPGHGGRNRARALRPEVRPAPGRARTGTSLTGSAAPFSEAPAFHDRGGRGEGGGVAPGRPCADRGGTACRGPDRGRRRRTG